MTKPATIASPPCLKGKTEIIQRGLIGIKMGAGRIGPQYIDMLRRQLEDLSKLAFALPDLLLRLLCRGDVHHRSDKFYEVAFLVDDRMSDSMEMLDSSVGKNNAVVRVIVCFLDSGSFIEFVKSVAIFRVHQSKVLFPIWKVASLRI